MAAPPPKNVRGGSRGVACPVCQETLSKVIDSRRRIETGDCRRRRLCRGCGIQYTTIETVAWTGSRGFHSPSQGWTDGTDPPDT